MRQTEIQPPGQAPALWLFFLTAQICTQLKRARHLHNLKRAVGCGEDFEVLNIGSCHVALVESTGTSVSQADGFLCGTKGGKGHVTSGSRSAAQILRSGLTERNALQICRWGKKQQKSCSFGRAFARSSEHNPFSSAPSLSTRVRGILDDKRRGREDGDK